MYYKGNPVGEELNKEFIYFANQVGLIVGLESNGKIDTLEAYKKIKSIWKEVKNKKKKLYS